MLSIGTALGYTLVMGLVIFFCRFLPFVIIRPRDQDEPGNNPFLTFVEKIVPPVAMTVLAFSSIVSSVKDSPDYTGAIAVTAASAVTALLHIWKRNSLISIFSGTLLYMILIRLL